MGEDDGLDPVCFLAVVGAAVECLKVGDFLDGESGDAHGVLCLC